MRTGSISDLAPILTDVQVAVVAPFGADPVNGVLVAAVAGAAAAADHGVQVQMWLPHEWPQEGFEAHLRRLDDAGVSRVVLDSREPARPWLRRAALARAASRPVDVVHLHSVFSPHVAQLARAVGRPYVLTPHGGYSAAALQRGRGRKRLALATFEGRLLRRASAIVALTEAEARELSPWVGDARVEVVPNGVDPPPAVDRGALRRELGLGANELLAVFAGRLDAAHKGLDSLIDGVAEQPEWTLALVGPDDRGDRADLEARARTRGAAERCRFLGMRQGRALHEALAAGDVFALCSRWEGLPLTLLEALAHGTPALVSPAVERAVPVAAHGAGWVSPRERVGATLATIAAIDRSDRESYRAAARRLAHIHRWEDVGWRMAAMYAQVVGSAGSGAPRGSREQT